MKLTHIHKTATVLENKEVQTPVFEAADEQHNHVIVDDGWQYKPNSQLGSNPGGLFIDPTGNKHYIKFYRNAKQVASEYAATKIHELMGVRVMDVKMAVCENQEFVDDFGHRGIHMGSIGIISEWNPNLKVLGNRFYQINQQDANHLGRSYMAAILCENWDIIGLEVDNQVRDEVTKELISVDHGRSFKFRAQGGEKDFNHGDIKTKDSLKKFSPASDVFNFVFTKFPEAEHNAIARLHTIHHQELVDIFEDAGFHDAAHMADNVMSRVDALLEHYDQH